MSTESQQHATAIAAPVATPAASFELDPMSPEAHFKAGLIDERGLAMLVKLRDNPSPEPLPRKIIPGPITLVYSKTSPPLITPETVLELIQKPALSLGPGHYHKHLAYRISANLVVKAGERHHPAEATMMDFVRAHTNIPVPTVHLVFTRIEDMDIPRFVTTYIVMDYISGPTLQYLWETLDAPTKTSVLAQLQGYIRELRSIPPGPDTAPGPLGGGKCEGMWFGEDGVGPFPTHQALVDWWNRCFARPGEFYYNPAKTYDRFDTEHPLVFTHGDFNPRNLIMHEGVVWVIDWQLAGWYPWFIEPTRIARDMGLPDWETPRDWAVSVLPFFPDISRELRMFDGVSGNVSTYWYVSKQRPSRFYHTATPASEETSKV
ncbi:hypothetical protein TRAPUB_7969 [Trametes pubescens]|uniref:Aminoglycoside phosphotransferase domain-containing protein n=1 Tax=Trametes pubescens TaxID=154538 RepID=A0A1M2V1U6_TRAPU|nr:hypothetical protein TRAPUB_7969 [Trametes pubescens]